MIHFKRGDTWRIPEDDTLRPDSGDATGAVTYTSYGTTGDKPLFLGSVEKNNTGDWTAYDTNIWTATDSSFGAVAGQDVGSIIFNNEVSWGDWKLSQAELVEQGDFYYEEK
ncbi:MAG TPA: hypothetical protein ENG83_12155 [Nitrospirae bacterium]|nr:hypothetical protein BMS3Abin06_02872 [bacterium BMS3Abin06]HDH12928.1 hypothetical protein [Nitrospirota bacterium]HDL19853.1 hypothetical protein [Nitrospirota bacterium]HDZ01660.1 hypothetical protein [Nitrospirota bacterium]